MSAVAIAQILDLILLGVQIVPAVRAEMEELKGRLMQMSAEGREPTAEEWNTLNASIADKLARLEAAAGE
jgi:hypothetical protein